MVDDEFCSKANSKNYGQVHFMGILDTNLCWSEYFALTGYCTALRKKQKRTVYGEITHHPFVDFWTYLSPSSDIFWAFLRS